MFEQILIPNPHLSRFFKLYHATFPKSAIVPEDVLTTRYIGL